VAERKQQAAWTPEGTTENVMKTTTISPELSRPEMRAFEGNAPVGFFV